MLGKHLTSHDKLLLAAVALSGLLFALSVAYSGNYLPASSPAVAEEATEVAPEYRPHTVAAQTAVIDGLQVGEVLVDDSVVLRLRIGAGGYDATQRAVIVADRLRDLVLVGLAPDEIHAGVWQGEPAVIGAGELIVTADSAHARANNIGQVRLAETWARNIASSLGGESGPTMITREQAAAAWEPAEVYDDKDVPIISVGRGVRIGMARVSGPRSKVQTVKGVAQLEANISRFGDAEIYVPITTETPGRTLDRVSECAVVGLADLGI